MRIAITGATGTVGRVLVAHALDHGHSVVAIDVAQNQTERAKFASDARSTAAVTPPSSGKDYKFIQVDLRDYDEVVSALNGCNAVAHLAANKIPGDGIVATHNNNVVVSWNVLRAAAELGIARVAQASSINAIGLTYYQGHPPIDYLPLDEAHPCRPDDPYSLSKQICEAQADTIVRRFTHMRIASLRIHMVVPTRDHALRTSPSIACKQLWGYTLDHSCASAFLLALTAEHPEFQRGHETFFIVEPDLASDENVEVLIAREWKGVAVRGQLIGKSGLFDCSKAAKLLSWQRG